MDLMQIINFRAQCPVCLAVITISEFDLVVDSIHECCMLKD